MDEGMTNPGVEGRLAAGQVADQRLQQQPDRRNLQGPQQPSGDHDAEVWPEKGLGDLDAEEGVGASALERDGLWRGGHQLQFRVGLQRGLQRLSLELPFGPAARQPDLTDLEPAWLGHGVDADFLDGPVAPDGDRIALPAVLRGFAGFSQAGIEVAARHVVIDFDRPAVVDPHLEIDLQALVKMGEGDIGHQAQHKDQQCADDRPSQ